MKPQRQHITFLALATSACATKGMLSIIITMEKTLTLYFFRGIQVAQQKPNGGEAGKPV